MKNFLKIILVLPFLFTVFFLFGCKAETETEYVTKTEYVEKDKQFAKTVVFAAEDAGESGVKVTMSTATEGAKIYYTTDGIEPTEKSSLYSSPVNFTKNVTVKAVAIKSGMENSPISVATVSMTEKTVTVMVEKEPDTIPPKKTILTENSVVAGNGKVLLSWQNPDDEDFYGTEISFTPVVDGVIQPIVVEGEKSGNSSILINGLEDESEYTFSLVSIDKSQNKAEPVIVKAKTLPDTSDRTPPAEVMDLTVTPLSNRVKLEWNDPSDEDLFGIEVSQIPVENISRAVTAMEEKSIFVAPGMECVEVPFLENCVEYQFLVKTMDENGNKSAGVAIKSTPIPDRPLKIELSIPEEKSNTSVTMTAKIDTTAKKVEKVVCKKGGSTVETDFFADSDVMEMVQDSSDSSNWSLKIDATDESFNGLYTVASIDSEGHIETAQIWIDNFDFTPPGNVSLVYNKYDSMKNTIYLEWQNPEDKDFDHVEITYTINDGKNDSEQSSKEIVIGDKKSFDVPKVGEAYRTYYFVSVDKVGNESAAVGFDVRSNGFIKIPGADIDGTEKWTPESDIFISGRKLKFDSFYMCNHELTRAEYGKTTGGAKYGERFDAYDKDGNKLEGEAAGDNPTSDFSWETALIYCNIRSLKEGLEPCYTIDGKTYLYYSQIYGEGSVEYKRVDCDFKANGYRLPTEVEWEWAARGGENYTYAGSDDVDEVAWNREYKNGEYGTRDVMTKKPNGYGLYDMSGNVNEWCWDVYMPWKITKSTPVTGETPNTYVENSTWGRQFYSRGGGVGYYSICRISHRENITHYELGIGIRLVRSVQ